LFVLAAVFQTIAFAIHLQYVDMTGQPVKKSADETFGAEGGGTLGLYINIFNDHFYLNSLLKTND